MAQAGAAGRKDRALKGTLVPPEGAIQAKCDSALPESRVAKSLVFVEEGGQRRPRPMAQFWRIRGVLERLRTDGGGAFLLLAAIAARVVGAPRTHAARLD